MAVVQGGCYHHITPDAKCGLIATPVADEDTPTKPAEFDQRRYFVENDTITGWAAIAGAIFPSYTPEAVFTTDPPGDPPTHADDSDFQKCLRATVTYRDAVDRTHSPADDQHNRGGRDPRGDLGKQRNIR